jgi:hypothetical protein
MHRDARSGLSVTEGIATSQHVSPRARASTLRCQPNDPRPTTPLCSAASLASCIGRKPLHHHTTSLLFRPPMLPFRNAMVRSLGVTPCHHRTSASRQTQQRTHQGPLPLGVTAGCQGVMV